MASRVAWASVGSRPGLSWPGLCLAVSQTASDHREAPSLGRRSVDAASSWPLPLIAPSGSAFCRLPRPLPPPLGEKLNDCSEKPIPRPRVEVEGW